MRLQSESDFVEDEVFETLLAASNLTVSREEVNGTEVTYVDSYGSEAAIVTPAIYACNVSLQHSAACWHESLMVFSPDTCMNL